MIDTPMAVSNEGLRRPRESGNPHLHAMRHSTMPHSVHIAIGWAGPSFTSCLAMPPLTTHVHFEALRVAEAGLHIDTVTDNDTRNGTQSARQEGNHPGSTRGRVHRVLDKKATAQDLPGAARMVALGCKTIPTLPMTSISHHK